MGAPDQGALDPTAVRAFVRMVHDAAARALEGAADPGMLQLDFLHPNGGSMHSTRFPIGAVDAMADSAINAAEGGLNVYVEGRTVDVRTSAGRGKANATRGLFAFVNDSDGDKGKAGAMPIAPTWSIESSPGNRHDWIVLDRALTADEAEPLGRALRARIGSDSATAKLTQPYRVAGTPNFPDARKRARGRTVEATRILSTDGPLWTAAQLAKVAPPVETAETAADASSEGRSGASSATFNELVAEAGPDRSERFFRAVRVALRAGMLRGDVEDAMRAKPQGCASKYLEPTDRLAEEIARAWGKVQAKAQADATQPAVEATYPDRAVPVDDARTAVKNAIKGHFAAGVGHRAIRVGTGIGKTRAAARAVAEDVRRRRAEGDRGAALYLVPTHKLGEEVAELFRSEGVTARVFRGRSAEDPEAPDTGRKMCLDTEAVDLALSLGRTVSTSCCRAKHPKTGTMMHCAAYSDCAYQRQIRDTPEVWVGAHDLLFSAPAGLGHVSTVVVDEGFWGTGIRIGARGISLDEVKASPSVGRNDFEMMAAADVAAWRARLARALARQEGLSGVERRHLVAEGLTVEICTSANKAEWRLKDKVEMWPGMGPQARRAALRLAETAGKVGRVAPVWNAARELLRVEDPDAVSGRLVLAEGTAVDGSKARVVRTHGVRKVLDRWLDVPVLIIDATLPSLGVLRAFLPDVEIAAEVEATAPHARVRQVLGAPVSAGKLMGSKAGRNREAIRRAVLHRFVEAGRCPTLVVLQKDAAEWLRASRLPAEITVAHFGAIAGLDGFKGVGLLIAIGRTMPSVTEVETYAGAVTGLDPLRTAEPAKGPRWYDKAALGLRLAAARGKAVQGDRHPDPTAEAIRWQIAEGGVLQAIGRARAVNRTAADPVAIEVWNDLCLPMTVDEVAEWDAIPSGHDADMLVDGIVLESPSDMAKCWPAVWESEKAAEHWRTRTTRPQNPIGTTRPQNPIGDHHREMGACAFRYRHPGERQKWRSGWRNSVASPDPRAWLEARLGPLAAFEILLD